MSKEQKRKYEDKAIVTDRVTKHEGKVICATYDKIANQWLYGIQFKEIIIGQDLADGEKVPDIENFYEAVRIEKDLK